MKILLLCFVALLVVAGLLFTKVVSVCASYQENDSDLLGGLQSCPAILPRKTGQVQMLSRDQRFFVGGFALGTLSTVIGAWLLLSWAN